MNFHRWIMGTVWCVSVFTLCGCFLSFSPVFGEELGGNSQDLIEKEVNGWVNWSSGRLVAKGIGIPSSSGSASVGRAMAGRAAKAVALRNLLEIVKGVRMDSTTTVKNYVVESDEIQAKVSGLVKNAREIKRALFPDGSVEITLSMELWGDHSLLSSLGTFSNSTPFSNPDHASRDSSGYSGVILDARGLVLKPVAFPSVLDPEKKAILPLKVKEQLKGQSWGGAQYFMLKDSLPLSNIWSKHSVADKQETKPVLKRVGPRPLLIKGLAKAGFFKSDIIVSGNDAKKIRDDKNLMQALREGRIIIVTDPLIAGVEGRMPVGATFLVKGLNLTFAKTQLVNHAIQHF